MDKLEETIFLECTLKTDITYKFESSPRVCRAMFWAVSPQMYGVLIRQTSTLEILVIQNRYILMVHRYRRHTETVSSSIGSVRFCHPAFLQCSLSSRVIPALADLRDAMPARLARSSYAAPVTRSPYHKQS